MNAYLHSQLSVKRRKGKIEDYYILHDFADCSKEVHSQNSHRIFMHNLWGIKNIMIPIFGHTIVNSDGISCNVKDICEQDHCLPDFRNRFIATLIDFVDCVDEIPGLDAMLDKFFSDNEKYFAGHPGVKELLLSPLWNTGKKKSLLVTHNSWFLGHILPKVFPKFSMPVINYEINPSLLFNNMSYKTWMNGDGVPPSFQKICDDKKKAKSSSNSTVLTQELKD